MPLTEMQAWVSLTGIELTLWEVETIQELSNVYVASIQKYEGKKGSLTPPFMSVEGFKEQQRDYAKMRKAQMTGK